ncbi:MAG: hypothetical protein K0R34_3547 [Herbinix sp.]|nr:hypothetical protein [Herbinix sp.]
MERYIGKLLHSAEKRVVDFIRNQVKDPDRRDFGGLKMPMVDVKPTVYALTTAVAVYLNGDSSFYHDANLLEVMNRALDFVALCQREDGSFDYPTCNFKSAPDTAFCFKRLIAAYRLLLKYDTESTIELKEKYFVILCRALEAIRNGGFHTPNHRWAICAALMQGANLLAGKPTAERYLARAKEYLAEGIDQDEDGQYAERSTGGYNAVVNNAMLAMYEESKDATYLGIVERNLHMMLTYVDPDDTIFTQNSTRQDQGKTEFMDKYFYQYLYLASVSFNAEFDAAAHKIIKDCIERGSEAPDCLHYLMLNDRMRDYRFLGYGFMDSYRCFYPNPGVMRVKTPKYGYTLLKDNGVFLFLKVRETLIYVKLGESFCAVRNFIPQTMEVSEGEYTMTSKVKSWYYLPFQDYKGTNDWWKMDHSKRELLQDCEVDITVTMKELEDGLQLNMKSEGLDMLPLRLCICIPAGSTLENEHFYLQAEKGSGMILRDGYLHLTHNQNHIQIGPGFGTHEFPGHYSGEDKNDMGYTIYFNDYTPCDKTITFRILE